MSGPVARLPVGRRIRKTVPASSSLTIDTVVTAKFRKIRYDLTAWQTGGKSKGMNLDVLNDDGEIFNTVYGRIGISLSMSIGASLSGSDTILVVTNPNAFDIEVEALRFKIGGQT